MAQALQRLSDGRFTLGLGLGWNRVEHEQSGIVFPSGAERAALLAATAGLLEDVPLLIGGTGERATLPLVARFADEWNMTTASPDLVRQRSAVLASLCAEIGRDPAAITRSVAVGYLIGRDGCELRQRSARLQQWAAPLNSVTLDEVPEAARGMSWLVGTPDDFRAQLTELEGVGIERVIFGHYDLDDLQSLELVADLA
jgi:alkanesulfonate monooxygenase SsuD/methylene tetrahydromethanopterin reductase-like flavin-dependent oxidoreductase (luciferase family)